MALYDRMPRNAAPRAWFTGTKDNSRRSVPSEPKGRAIHLPFYPIFSSKGLLEPQLVAGSEVTDMFGSEFLDTRSKFATPVIPYVQDAQRTANMMFLQRLVPNTIENVETATARVVLCLDLTSNVELPEYERDEDGRLIPIPVPTDPVEAAKLKRTREKYKKKDTTVRGFRGQWVLVDANKLGKGLGEHEKQVIDGETTRYPIIEFEATSFGSYGNNLGLAVYAPTKRDQIPADLDLIRDNLAYTYRLSFFRRDTAYTNATLIRNNDGEDYVDFTFKTDAYDGNNPLYADPRILENYRNTDTRGNRTPTFGPFNEIHVYDDYVDEVLTKLCTAEIEHYNQAYPNDPNKWFVGSIFDELTASPRPVEEAKHIFNFLSGVDPENRPYFTYQVEDEVTALQNNQSKIVLTKDSRVFALGGRDGLDKEDLKGKSVSEVYDETCRQLFSNLGQDVAGVYPLDDMGQYPFKNIYDVGYSLETKEQLFNFLKIRPDVNVVVTPYDFVTKSKQTKNAIYNQRRLGEVKDILRKLNSWANNYPESVIYGTSVCRVVIPSQAGYLIDSEYKHPVSTALEIQRMRSDFMGSGEGAFRAGGEYDRNPNNEVVLLKDLNHIYLNVDNREDMWSKSAVWFESKQLKTLFCPAVQTAYRDDTSVLNSDINMQAICEANMVCREVWAEITGRSDLSDEDLIALSDATLIEKFRNKFNGRFVITPETHLTRTDELKGYSWTCHVHMEMPNMKTVARNTVIAHRLGARESQ